MNLYLKFLSSQVVSIPDMMVAIFFAVFGSIARISKAIIIYETKAREKETPLILHKLCPIWKIVSRLVLSSFLGVLILHVVSKDPEYSKYTIPIIMVVGYWSDEILILFNKNLKTIMDKVKLLTDETDEEKEKKGKG